MTKRFIIRAGLFVLLVLVNIMAWGYVYRLWHQPLSPTLDLPPPTLKKATLTPTNPPLEPSGTPTPAPTNLPTSTPAPTTTPTLVPVCGGPPSMTLLVSGVASNRYIYGLADAVRVVHIDFQRKTISILALPRDLWVDIPHLANYGIQEGKLNQAYFYGTEGMGYYQGPGYGSGLLAHTLLVNFSLHVDHYLAVNLRAFRQIVDAMGGIDVYFSKPIYLKHFGEPKLYKKAGHHHLTGKEAEKVVRTRIKVGDFGRIQHQTLILKAVAAKILSPQGLKSLPTLVNNMKHSVMTDLSPAEINSLICLLKKMDPQQDIFFPKIPNKMLDGTYIWDEHLEYNAYALTYDEEEMQQFLAAFWKGITKRKAIP